MNWYDTEMGAERLALEIELLELSFPQMSFNYCNDGTIRVEGYLRPNNCSSHYVVAEYPYSYPRGRVRVFLPNENIPSDCPHTYSTYDGELCIEHSDFQPTDTMEIILGWTAQWLILFENYKRTGERW